MSGPVGSGTVPTTRCHTCDSEVPAANFCGYCGSDLAADPEDGPQVLRVNAFGAAPDEAVLRPYLASSLFPQLPDRSRRPFRIAIVLAALGLLVSGLLRLPSLGIAVGALGLPLLFGFYLRAARIDRDIDRRTLGFAVVLGAGLGTAWVLVSGHVVAQNFGVPMVVGLALHHLVREGLAIPVIGMALMIVPTVVIRLVRPQPREALAGFAVGALSTLAFTAAATLTRLAPQTSTGLIAHVRPLESLVVQAVLCGVSVPLTAAAAGGMVGALLWFRHPKEEGRDHHLRLRLLLILLTAGALLLHAGAGVIDMIGFRQTTMMVVHLGSALAALIALRMVLQFTMLHETHDPIHEDRPLLCVHCEHVVPDMAFCVACGVAGRASSLTSRRERRESARPQPMSAATGLRAGDSHGDEVVYPGFALPDGSYEAPPVRRTRSGWLLSRWGVGITAAAVVLGAVALVLTPKVAHFMCPPDCGRPPNGNPVMALPRFEAADGTFSVSYPAPGSAYTVRTAARGVTATYTGGDGGVLQLFSEPAAGRTAAEVVRATLRRANPNARVDYRIPNAMVGYQPGYGEVADDWPQSTSTSSVRLRIVVLAAVKNDVALIAFATGPFRAFGPDFGPGPPSGANLELAQDMGKYVNSFRWSGDPQR